MQMYLNQRGVGFISGQAKSLKIENITKHASSDQVALETFGNFLPKQ